MSGWPSGLRRQTQGEYLTLMIGSCIENSGPRMRAWVQIPLLTATFCVTLCLHLNNNLSMKIVLAIVAEPKRAFRAYTAVNNR